MPEPTIWALVEEACQRQPGRRYCWVDGSEVSTTALRALALAAAEWLRGRGVGPGDRVAVMLPNGREHVALIFGLQAVGAVYIPLNLRAKGPGLAFIIQTAEPSAVIADESVRESILTAAAAAGWKGELIMRGDLDIPDGPRRPIEPVAESTPDDVRCILFTSGTTGPPKGVQLTDRMLQISAAGVREATEPRAGDVHLVWEPFYHLGGYQMLVLALTEPVSLAILPRFSASSFWQDAITHGATHLHYLGGVLQILLKQPPKRTDRAHRIRIAWGAGGSGDGWEQFEERFGVQLREVYGLTETASINTLNRGERPGSMGRPINGYAIEVVDERDTVVPPGTTGELRMRGNAPGMVTPGYYRNAGATAKLLRDGWVYTGDRVRADEEGYLYFCGRLTDNVRVGGENVSAWEVEAAVRDHPAVADCAMVGVASPLGEQDIKVFVQRASDDLTESELIEWCAARLGRYQVPRYVEWIEAFQRGPSLRILKHDLDTGVDRAWDREAARQ